MRRIAAVVVPRMLCEMVSPQQMGEGKAFGVVLCDVDETSKSFDTPRRGETTKLDAVSFEAQRLGIEPGDCVTQARARVADFQVYSIPRHHLKQRISTLADLALNYTPTVQIGSYGTERYDTVLLDVTAMGHLYDSEAHLGRDLVENVQALGHQCRVCIASGPRIAACLARYNAAATTPEASTKSPNSTIPTVSQHRATYETHKYVGPEQQGYQNAVLVVSTEMQPLLMHSLPIDALQMPHHLTEWFRKLGVRTVGQLRILPTTQLTARLGRNASDWLRLASGIDPTPLVAYHPTPVFVEQLHLEEHVYNSNTLVFCLNRLALRLSARLQAAHLALTGLHITLELDRSIASINDTAPSLSIVIQIPHALQRAQDLLSIVQRRIEQLTSSTGIKAPITAVSLQATHLTQHLSKQLSICGNARAPNEALALVLAELTSELGPERIGTLHLTPSHLADKSSTLRPPPANVSYPMSSQLPLTPSPPSTLQNTQITTPPALTRLLPTPVVLADAQLTIPCTTSIDQFDGIHMTTDRFDTRIDRVEWWLPNPVSRDYYRIWVSRTLPKNTRYDTHHGSSPTEDGALAWVFRDRTRGGVWLHGWFD